MHGNIGLRKTTSIVKVYFYIVVQEYGCRAEILFSFRFYGDRKWTIATNNVDFGMEIEHKHAYTLTLRMKYCMYVNDYKHGDGVKLWD
jgi:hypothetical protein